MEDSFRITLSVYLQTIHHDEKGNSVAGSSGGISASQYIDVPATDLTDAIKALGKFQAVAEQLKAEYAAKNS